MKAIINIITRLSQGNPGAAVFLMEMYKADSLFFEVFVQEIEPTGLKGTDLYVMYSDICGKDLRKVASLLAKCPQQLLIEACKKQDRSGRAMVAQYLQ